MGRILDRWKRDKVIDIDTETHTNTTAFDPANLKPNPQVKANRRFREPPTVLSDFYNNLMEDKPFVNYTYELIHDWYARQEVGYEKIYVRAQQTPIDWKSKIGNSDMSSNFKTTHQTRIYKGDFALREDGTLFILTWNVTDHANNQATQSVECNDYLTFTRETAVETDDEGYVIDDLGYLSSDDDNVHRKIIAKDMPVSHAEYAGRPDFSMSQGQPGVLGDHLITITTQWNSVTRNIRIGDTTKIGFYTYRIINVSTAEVHIDKQRGVLIMNAKRVAGGGLDAET